MPHHKTQTTCSRAIHGFARCAALLALLLLACLQAFASTVDSITTGQLVRFRHDSSIQLMQISLGDADQEIEFRKEPAYLGQKVYHGLIRLTKDKSNWLGYAWDPTARKLYLDHNRNLDLSDDTSSTIQASSSCSLSFPIEITQGGTRESHTVTLLFWDPVNQVPKSFYIHCGWRARLELEGKRWELCVWDNLDGVIDSSDRMLLFPCAAQDARPMRAPDFELLPVASRIDLNGKCYDLDFRFARQTTQTELLCQMSEASPKLGQLHLEGKLIERLSFHSANCLAIFDRLTSTIQLPVDAYSSVDVRLNDGAGCVVTTKLSKPLAISQDFQQTLKVAAPIQSTLKVSRMGSFLSMDYTLAGQGGETYRLIDFRSQAVVGLQIYKGNTLLASNKMEYG